jgi:hypothetical protein
MADQLSIRELRDLIRRTNRRLRQPYADPLNSDRALWGALAVASFASVTGQSEEVGVDPETVLGDLLAGLMHWCDVQKANRSLEEPIDFESALERARNHYQEDFADEREQRSGDNPTELNQKG